MKVYTFVSGELAAGIRVVEHERFGQVVSLGTEGRGRWSEKVGLFRKNPAAVTDGRIYDAYPVKITVNRGAEREREFYTLAKPHHQPKDGSVLVRICTQWSYTRNTTGHWKTHQGNPEDLVVGYGAHGDAGRIGRWYDGIVQMRPGDVLQVKPEGGYKSPTYALWVAEDGSPAVAEWDDFENIRALETVESGQDVDILFGRMSAYTYGSGGLEEGIEVASGNAGAVVALGESGRGREYAEVPVLGPAGESVTEAGVTSLSEEKGVYALLTDDRVPMSDDSSVLLRVSTIRRVHRQVRHTEVISGNPTNIATGMFAGGAAGFAGRVDDTLWVLGDGDGVVLTLGRDENIAVVENCDGKLVATSWEQWEKADAERNPAKYIADGKAPWGQVPESWVGRVVSVIDEVREWDDVDNKYARYLRTTHCGEAVSVNPLVLNPGWDGCDYHEVAVESGVWVELDQERNPNRLTGEALAEREAAKAEVEKLKADAVAVREQEYFSCLEPDLREKVDHIADGESRWGDPIDFAVYTTPSMQSWVRDAAQVMSDVTEVSESAVDLSEQTREGKILTEFEAGHRRGGVTGCGDGWVVRADGSLREPDERDVPRFKSDGTYRWNLVTEEELALVWHCGTTRDVDGSSGFIVEKMPVGGLTDAQRAAVALIEDDIGASRGVFGLDPEIEAEKSRLSDLVRDACARVGILSSTPDDLDINALSGQWGIEVPFENINGNLGRHLNHNAPFDAQCANRDAQVVEALDLDDGSVLEFLVYDKYGQLNLNIRLRQWCE